MTKLRRGFPGAALPAVLLFTVLRIPSFFEPHWYTDEAGYVTTGRALLRGRVLYEGIWTNKPPLHPWTIAILLRLLGPDEWALHLLTYLSGLLVVLAVAYAALRIGSFWRAVFAALAVAVMLGLPIFDAELAIPESVLIAPITWAGALVVAAAAARPARLAAWPVLAGLLAAVAVAYQQTALAEFTALALVMALSPVITWRQLLLYIAAFGAATVTWLAGVLVVAKPSAVAFALAGFYVPYTQSASPSAGHDRLVYLSALLGAAALLFASAVLLRRTRAPWQLVLWLGAALSVPAAAHLPYPHFLAPSAAPAALLASALPLERLNRLRARSLARPTVAGSLAAVAALVLVGMFAIHAGMDWVPPAAGAPWINSYRTLTAYYGNAVGVASGHESTEDWGDIFDGRVRSDRDVARWLRDAQLQQATVVVWSSDAWPYVLADSDLELPTAPIYNDVVILGSNDEVVTRVRDLDPQVIVTSDDELAEYPAISSLLSAGYRPAFFSDPDTVWVRQGVPTPSGM